MAALAALTQQAGLAHADLPPSEAEVFDKLRNNLDQFPAGQPGSAATAQGRRDLAEDAGNMQQVGKLPAADGVATASWLTHQRVRSFRR